MGGQKAATFFIVVRAAQLNMGSTPAQHGCCCARLQAIHAATLAACRTSSVLI
jgi:hypothetical protein